MTHFFTRRGQLLKVESQPQTPVNLSLRGLETLNQDTSANLRFVYGNLNGERGKRGLIVKNCRTEMKNEKYSTMGGPYK